MDKIQTLLERGVEEVIVKEHLQKALASGKKLRVKFGIDPTAPDLHLGHLVPLRKLKQFQDNGHKIILIIGDFTAMIGDPSGREGTRKPLTKKEVKANMKKYLKQAGKIIDIGKAEVKYNSKWLSKDPQLQWQLSGLVSVSRALERDDFQKRLQSGRDVMLLEVMYPLLQGYDSVVVKADVEIGGTDQKFNLLMGRRIQRAYGIAEQDVMTLPLLEGTDGVKKMSKSYGNYIALDEEPNNMFGKIMRIPDNLIDKYRELLTDLPSEALTGMSARDAKLKLAEAIVSQLYGAKAGINAKEEFIKVFSKKELPEHRPKKYEVAGKNVIDGLVEAGVVKSKSEARRLVKQGGVKINGKKVENMDAVIPKNATVQIGPHRFFDT